MDTEFDRRAFLKAVSLGSAQVAFLAGANATAADAASMSSDSQQVRRNTKRSYNGTYTGERLNRIAFPLGGIGAGMVCIEGSGALSHVSIRNKPDIFNEPTWFAALHIQGVANGAKVLEGPVPDWKKFGQKESGLGTVGATTGLPRFHQAAFLARFPFAHIGLTDPELPLQARITAWSPFVPTDEDASSLPVAALEYEFENSAARAVDAVFSFHSKNFLPDYQAANAVRALPSGFILSGTQVKAIPIKTELAAFVLDDTATVDHCWFRGTWWDSLTVAWNTVRDGVTRNTEPVKDNAPGASLYVPFTVAAKSKRTIRLLLCWYTPESVEAYGTPGAAKEDCTPARGCCNSPADIGLDRYDGNFDAQFYKPWYSSQFASIEKLSAYWREHYATLRDKSLRFTTAFYKSTLPDEVMEAVAANLTILKSPTVLRQHDGRFWAFEGCGDTVGSCHGSCTHVWNYAQAVAHLFPALERSLRATEFCENQDAQGHQMFRATLPIKPNTHDFHSAADGQLGGIMKVHREWRASADTAWLKKIFPMVRTSMDYCIRTWDPQRRGLIEEPHHNTYDIEFWGPDGMHASFYIGALTAFSAMGDALGQDMRVYRELAATGRRAMELQLFDGDYFIQKVDYKNLQAGDPTRAPSSDTAYSAEVLQLFAQEGPKYQYGKGCLADGVLGAWLGRMCGLGDTIDADKVKKHLASVHRHNFKQDLSRHANPQRPTFALGNEGGLLLCTWPKGGQPSLPFVYSAEVWTGIEHQVASHLMLLGLVREGLEILRTSRDRYDGRIRNPFNEYECGHWYARALSSYGYLQALTGLRYDMVDKALYVDSHIGDFTCFLSCETGFGTVTLSGGKVSVDVAYGVIEVRGIFIGARNREPDVRI